MPVASTNSAAMVVTKMADPALDVARCIENASLHRTSSAVTVKPELELEISRLREQVTSLPQNVPPVECAATSTAFVDRQSSVISTDSNQDLVAGQEPATIETETVCANMVAPGIFHQEAGHNSMAEAGGLKQLSQIGRSNATYVTHTSTCYTSKGKEPSYQDTDASSSTSKYVPRTIAGREFSASKLAGCISCFFSSYAQNVPGLVDTLNDPMHLFIYSEFLFWTIVYIGSRKFTKDPTIVEFLAKPLGILAQQCLFEPDQAIPSIQAAILICLWPLPDDTNCALRSHAMAGAAMQLALQKGLPFASRKQDFFRISLGQSEKDETFRARLWAYCVMVFQGGNIYDGFLCTMGVDTIHLDRNLSVFSDFSPLVAYQYQLHHIHVEAITAILNVMDPVTNKHDHLLNSLVNQFDNEAQRVVCEPEDNLTCHALASVRLLIRAFHFFSAPNSQRNSGILQAYFIACEVIKIASQLDHSSDFGLYCTSMQYRVLALSAVIILRVLRSSLGAQVDADAGESIVFEAIRLARRRSIRNDDLEARNALRLTQLWSSDRAFLYRDGTRDGLRLLLHARLPKDGQQPLDPADTSTANAVAIQNVIEGRETMGLTGSESLENATFFGDLPDWNWEELQDGLLHSLTMAI
ncbi:uncharacterized protein PV06_08618 [Exophiala oligosperma]|uniref:Transcription factor domain-containing protein n=1 Tax=Exophiala oligosperma TaxID=215243 RepID=A0A0D2DCB6_9EURO|nr:uncharacterized protein PV06_08618 [Exophiala oligosperma]KIW40065.1 hypothetical protein PV06_08618 [Exophiala oligosperma]